MALKDYLNTGDNANRTINSTTLWRGMTFTTGDDYDIYSIALKVIRVGTPGNIAITIQETTLSKPNGSVLASGTLLEADIPSDSADWRTVVLGSTASLTSGTKYAIVWNGPGIGGGSSFTCRASSANPYAGGTSAYSTDSGSTWTLESADDVLFETYTADIENLGATLNGVSAFSATIHVLTTYEMEGTFAGVSAFSATITATQTSTSVPNSEPIFYMYLVAANNSRIYYEEIE